MRWFDSASDHCGRTRRSLPYRSRRKRYLGEKEASAFLSNPSFLAATLAGALLAYRPARGRTEKRIGHSKCEIDRQVHPQEYLAIPPTPQVKSTAYSKTGSSASPFSPSSRPKPG